ncbi:AAA family ATPase [Parachitinimonas caeni]|uniref:AAA family ATPase n=1 Tax=Parachitinimonas caeni TaxID=3031301 RepID=A0ABT7DV02_9NEIS|nr:AAA family ATPase [Parachitinimonas caeni]MDK2123654.1 AAA family ATPase [Parachitinimonas caeni]
MSERFTHALIVGKCAPPHRGHQLVIDTALAEATRVTLLIWSNPDFPSMPNAVRAAWIRELYPPLLFPQLTIHVADYPPVNSEPDIVHREYVRQWAVRHHLSDVDVVYTSEDYGDGFAAHMGVTHRPVDRGRTRVPISGTQLRADPHHWREFLDPLVYRHFVERVVFLGAESTGKSTLTRSLADTYQTSMVPEFGDEVFRREGGCLQPHHYLEIAHGHRALEDAAALQAKRFLFCDTNAITTLSWAFLLNRSAPDELFQLADECQRRYRHVFVCADDFGHVQNGWRANTEVRHAHQGLILYDLARRGIRYHYLEGTLPQRINRVCDVLELRA